MILEAEKSLHLGLQVGNPGELGLCLSLVQSPEEQEKTDYLSSAVRQRE